MSFVSKFSLRTILTTSILALSLAPLVVVSFNAWRIANNTAEEKALVFGSTAKTIADKIDRNLFERYGDVQAFGLNHAVRNRDAWYQPSDTNPIVQAMNSYVDTYDIYYLTILVDLEGKVIAVNSKDQDGNAIDTSDLYGVSFTNAEWFKDCSKGNFYENEDGTFTGTVVEHLHVDPHASQIYREEGLALGYSAPVYGEDGDVIAYWKNVTKFSLVEDIILASYLEMEAQGTPSAEITLLDEVGNVIVDCDPKKSGKHAISRDMSIIGKLNLAEENVAAAERVVSGESGSMMGSWHSRKKINQVAGFAPLTGALGFPGMKWNVLVRVPETEAFAVARQAKVFIVIAAILIALVVVVFVYLVTRAANKFLVSVVESMEDASNGDFSNRVESRLSSDISRMADSFNRLLEDLSTAAARDIDYRNQIETISKSQAVIKFKCDGTVVHANKNFLDTLGYQLDDVIGQHHRIFVDPKYAQSDEYRNFWEKIRSGETVSGDFQRYAKDGSEIWIRGSYHGIIGQDGKVNSVVKYATDITEAKQLEMELEKKQEQEHIAAEKQRRKVHDLLEIVDQVAEGDLSVTVPDLGDDAIGRIASGVKQVVDNMRAVMTEVRSVAETVSDGASEMTTTSDHISSGAQAQAASLEQTAASLEEITSAVKLNTDNSQQAQQLAVNSREIAESGGVIVGDAVEAMSAINTSSKKIAEIIGTIDKIAFQTNLLALNAAVEAARAGEQGRGFAVVASEVQSLAQRSAGAAKEIKALIQDSVDKVENGTELVNRSGSTLEEIVTSVKRVADIVSEISAASTEQLTGIEQVNQAVSQMDRVTQTNASQTEEMTRTSRNLKGHSQRLRELIQKFRLGSESTPATTAPSETSTHLAGDDVSTQGNASQLETTHSDSSVHELDLIGVGADGEFEDF